MKNLIWILSILLVMVGIQISVVGQTFGTETASSPAIPSETNLAPTIFATNEYQLPYPGILPDNPLYVLKATRDKLVSFFISDPLKKAEFGILEADKRVNAGVYLYQKQKYSLIVPTISKGENYFEEAVGKVEEAKRQGQEVNTTLDRMEWSLSKHALVLDTLGKEMPKSELSGIVSLQQRVAKLQNRVRSFRPKNQQ